jgi:peptidoglycan-associated lipoprotein
MRLVVVSVSILGALTLGCAHEEQSAKQVGAPAAPTPPVARRAPLPMSAAPSSVAAAPKQKEDAAIYFDFDSSLLRDDARPVLQKVGAELKDRAETLRVEGNCDEVGTVEYNLALGEARARAAKDYLVHLGVPSSRIGVASYGSQRPKYPGHDDVARAKNRRDDLVLR